VQKALDRRIRIRVVSEFFNALDHDHDLSEIDPSCKLPLFQATLVRPVDAACSCAW
jgi:hypothetical protein